MGIVAELLKTVAASWPPIAAAVALFYLILAFVSATYQLEPEPIF